MNCKMNQRRSPINKLRILVQITEYILLIRVVINLAFNPAGGQKATFKLHFLKRPAFTIGFCDNSKTTY